MYYELPIIACTLFMSTENGVNQQYIAVSLEEGQIEEDEFNELELSQKGKEILLQLLRVCMYTSYLTMV